MSHLGDRLSALVDGELDGAELDRAHAHLAGCQQCRAEAAELRALKQKLRALMTGAPAEAAMTSRLVALTGPGGPMPPRRRLLRVVPGHRPAAGPPGPRPGPGRPRLARPRRPARLVRPRIRGTATVRSACLPRLPALLVIMGVTAGRPCCWRPRWRWLCPGSWSARAAARQGPAQCKLPGRTLGRIPGRTRRAAMA